MILYEVEILCLLGSQYLTLLEFYVSRNYVNGGFAVRCVFESLYRQLIQPSGIDACLVKCSQTVKQGFESLYRQLIHPTDARLVITDNQQNSYFDKYKTLDGLGLLMEF